MASSMARKSSSAMGPCSSSSFASPPSPSPPSFLLLHLLLLRISFALLHSLRSSCHSSCSCKFQSTSCNAPAQLCPQAPVASLRLGRHLSFVYLPNLMNINTTLVSFGANHVRSTGHGCCGTAALPYGAVSCMWQTLTHWALLKRDEDWFGQTIVCIHRIWHQNVNDCTRPTWYLSSVSLTAKGHFHQDRKDCDIKRFVDRSISFWFAKP